jgi:hypothetical protein
MSNNAFGSSTSSLKGDRWEAYERLHPDLRKALQDSLNDWSVLHVLKYCEEHGRNAAIDWLRYGDRCVVDKGWRTSRKVGVKNSPSPARACKVSILRANW